jgi:hypothetical protein
VKTKAEYNEFPHDKDDDRMEAGLYLSACTDQVHSQRELLNSKQVGRHLQKSVDIPILWAKTKTEYNEFPHDKNDYRRDAS